MNATLLRLLNVVTSILPLAGTFFFFIILLEAQQSSGVPITEGTVSNALASFPNYEELLVLLIIASTLMFLTTAVRNVQVRIWFRRRYGSYLDSGCCCCCCNKSSPPPARNKNIRQGSSSKIPPGSARCLAFTNDLGSVVNILAYTSFLVLAIVPSDAPTQQERDLHTLASVAYFSLSILYGILQVNLTSKQGKHYPRFIYVFQLVLVVVVAAASLIYVVTFFAPDLTPAYLAEWLIVFLNLAFVAFFAVLFCIDNAGDELVEYFCPCCCGANKQQGSKKSVDDTSYYRSMA